MAIRQYAKNTLISTVKHILRAFVYGLVGGAIVLVTFAVLYLDSRPNLKVWHTADLDEEFTVKSAVKNFNGYLALEERLFKQLNEQVYEKIAPEDKRKINRYNRGSLSDPQHWPTNWNRSFELSVEQPRAGVLLIHGMSDSPYSLRSIGQRLHADGAMVVGLRVPGHGTAPVGLVDVDWQDMAAVVKLAVHHVRERIGNKPLFIIGYSNGGALAVQYALTTLEDSTLPKVQGLVLLSPEIGVTKLAMLAVWQERLGHLLGMQKLAWNSIQPEYDTFKYGSFALNAGKQAYELTEEIQRQLTRLESGGLLEGMPPILAFQSVVDSTVTAQALVAGLFDRLPAGSHELVLFDINRLTEIEPLLNNDPTAWVKNMLKGRSVDYTVAVISNKSEDSEQAIARRRLPSKETESNCLLDSAWPDNVYSLSHIALPIPPNDPVYGGEEVISEYGIQLGNVAIRGERGVLQISADDLMRLRWNPFYSYLEQRTLEFIGLATPIDPEC